MLFRSIPVLYGGDEIAQVNDYTYKEDPDKAPDSRYIHRGAMNWELAGNIDDPDTVEGKLFGRLKALEEIRKREKVFVSGADAWTVETWEKAILCIGRYYRGEKLFGLFNFSGYEKTAWIHETDGEYVDLISGEKVRPEEVRVPAFGFYYLKKVEEPRGEEALREQTSGKPRGEEALREQTPGKPREEEALREQQKETPREPEEETPKKSRKQTAATPKKKRRKRA